MNITHKLRQAVYRNLNSPPFLNTKYAMRHHLANSLSLLNDARQLLHRKSPYYYKKYEPKMVMGRLFFQASSICNAKCIFCAYKHAKGPKGNMKFETFKKAADEYAEMGGQVINFTPTVGDPLLDPGLLKKIQYAVNLKGIKNVHFYTNGILLWKNNLYKRLVDSGIHDIRISMGETIKERYNRVYGVEAYDKLIKGLHKLLRYNKEQGEKVSISINFRSSTAPDEVINSPDFKKYIRPYLSNCVMYDFINDYDNWGGTITNTDLLGVMRLRRIPRVQRMPCRWTFDLMILFNGAVRVCACRIRETEFDELVVGNVHEESLKDIFYGQKVAAIRESFVKRQLPPVCRECSLYSPATEGWLKRMARGEQAFFQLQSGE